MAYYTSKQQSAMYFARKRRRDAYLASISVVALVSAALLLDGEANGFAADFTYSEDTAKMIGVKASGVLTEYAPDDFLTNAGTSPKLVYDATGTLVWSPHNRLIYSGDIDNALAWNTAGTGTSTATDLGDGVCELNIAATSAWSQSNSNVFMPGATYCFAIDVKRAASGSATHTAILTNNTSLLSSGTINKVLLTEEWQRIYTTITLGSGNDDISCQIGSRLQNNSNDPDCVGKVQVRRPQLNRGTVPTAYLSTTTAARYGLAIDHDPVTLECKGLLVEPAATNLCTTGIVTSLAKGANTTVTLMGSELGPDGKTGRVYRVQHAATSGSFLTLATGLTNATHTASVVAKAYTASKETFTLDFTVGAAASRTTHVATANWTRFNGTALADASSGCSLANGTDSYETDILVWVPQVELGTVATSPIPTFGTTVTRAADAPYVLTSSLPFFSATAGSLFAEARAASVNAFQTGGRDPATVFLESDSNNRIGMGRRVAGTLNAGYYYMANAGSTVVNNDSAIIANGALVKQACSWVLNDFESAQDGVTGTRDTSFTIPTVARLRVGNNEGGNGPWGPGHIRKIYYLPRKQTQAELNLRTAA